MTDQPENERSGEDQDDGVCPECRGTGKMFDLTCPRCDGSGKLTEGIGGG